MMTWKAAIVYPDGFNKEQVMVQKSLAIKNDDQKEETKDLESIHEETEKSESQDINNIETNAEISEVVNSQKVITITKHPGSIEEFLPSKKLMEQGQLQVEHYQFF